MHTRNRRPRALRRTAAVTTAAAAALALLAPPAAAEGPDERSGARSGEGASAQQAWLYDPAVVPNPRTSLAYSFSRGTAQIRFGTYNGTQYGWGRALNANGNHWIRFEVDNNGDRRWDLYNAWRVGARIYTRGYPTSSSSARAFRACIVVNPGDGCVSGGNGTYWW
ncbi:hypothetical protein O4J56_09790 [Nocardiopsis sp. RSe5-2]|uniref:Secreted protein n=1 Tax=Nocardiopsis endophytica TaxID=3018445 RepID=A0ABT4U1U0_9ACTN|nr:hypothetical protein [Nocardiopsis endophytica]MDA2810926.1 hypothetical protein [Nocardiopsis endophytica]